MKITVLSSQGRCGIHDYARVLAEGFEALGHPTRYVGVTHWDDRGLYRAALRLGRSDAELVVIEYEPGIFRLRPLLAAMAWLRLRGKRLLLSVHEIEPDKFPDSHHIRGRMHFGVHFGGVGEVARIALATADLAGRYGLLRLSLWGLGALPHRVAVHSPKAREQVGIALNPLSPKLFWTPLHIKARGGDRDAARRALGLPLEPFFFIVPGFLFRRKRIVEVIEALPAGSHLLVVGTPSAFDPGYVEEIEAAIAARPGEDVRLIQDYERMEMYLQAADVSVLFYADGFQSAIATHSVGAGLPCLFADLPAFEDVAEAGLTVGSPAALHDAMVQVQEPTRYAALRARVEAVRERHSPARVAAAYLAALGEEGP